MPLTVGYRVKNHYQHRVVLIENVSWKLSRKHNLMSVGGCTDTPLDLVAGGNADGKRPCLGNGQNVMMRTPHQRVCVIGHLLDLHVRLKLGFPFDRDHVEIHGCGTHTQET